MIPPDPCNRAVKEWRRNAGRIRGIAIQEDVQRLLFGFTFSPPASGSYRSDVLWADPCSYCGERPARTRDHLWPKSLGGDMSAENLVAACGACNYARGITPPLHWMLGVA